MRIFHLILVVSLLFMLPANAFAHTIDSAGPYRIEIGWLNEPAVSGSPNSIELLISPLPEGADPKDVKFANGVPGLHRDIKIQLVFMGESVKLPLSADHNLPGKYLAFVTPTISGYYQVNLLGKIGEQTLSLSMHPPKVLNNTLLEFPQQITHEPAKEKNTNELLPYVGIAIAVSALIFSITALRKR